MSSSSFPPSSSIWASFVSLVALTGPQGSRSAQLSLQNCFPTGRNRQSVWRTCKFQFCLGVPGLPLPERAHEEMSWALSFHLCCHLGELWAGFRDLQCVHWIWPALWGLWTAFAAPWYTFLLEYIAQNYFPGLIRILVWILGEYWLYLSLMVEGTGVKLWPI